MVAPARSLVISLVISLVSVFVEHLRGAPPHAYAFSNSCSNALPPSTRARRWGTQGGKARKEGGKKRQQRRHSDDDDDADDDDDDDDDKDNRNDDHDNDNRAW